MARSKVTRFAGASVGPYAFGLSAILKEGVVMLVDERAGDAQNPWTVFLK